MPYFTETITFGYVDPKNFNTFHKILNFSVSFWSSVLKMCENTLNINDWPKVQTHFSANIPKNGSTLKTDIWMSGFKCDWLQPWELFIFGKIKQKPWCNLLKCFKKIAPWFLPDFSRNQKPPWLGSVSFYTWHPKVRFASRDIWKTTFVDN